MLIATSLFTSVTLRGGDRKFDFAKIASHIVNTKGEKAKLDLRGKKFILVYYSSSWCGSCKSFTPKLVDFYNKHHKGVFEVVFMSLDFSEKGQMKYMKRDKMPWLAVKFSELKPSGLFDFAGCVMPWIAVFKTDGTWVPTNDLCLTNHTEAQVLANLKKTLSNPAGLKESCAGGCASVSMY